MNVQWNEKTNNWIVNIIKSTNIEKYQTADKLKS